MRGTLMSAFFGVALAGCLGAPAVPSGSGGTTSGSGGQGSGGTGSGGTTSGSGGTTASGGTTSASGGATGSGGSTSGSGGTTASGGTTSASGGASETGGATGTGGTNPDGGKSGSTGGAGPGGKMGSGGATGTGGSSTGGATGMGGTTGAPTFDKPLRLEDACGSIQDSSTCLHQGKTKDDALPFSSMTTVTMGGTQGTMYQVKIHIRGIVEPTTITGGTVGTPRQFVTGGSAKPDNGNSGDGAYNQWRLTTTVPNQAYYLNAYQNTGHNIYAIDYTETIMIGGGSVVKLDVHDANAHLITNTSGSSGGPVMAPAGAPALANNNVGQFVQIDVVP